MSKGVTDTMSRREVSLGLGAAALTGGLLGARPAAAQTFPSKDVHFICGFAAGSGADIIVRFMAERMRARVGRTIIVENKPGALGNIAAEYAARSAPDGHTILLVGGNALAANQHFFLNPTVDPVKDFTAFGTINRQPTMIAVGVDSPYKSIAELTDAMKKKGDKASYAYAFPTGRVVGAVYKSLAGLQAVEVQYRTGADYLNDLASGQVDFAVPDNVLAVGQARAGRMRILSVSTNERLQAAPEYPTMTELGYPMNIVGWWAGFVPTGTPRPIVDQLGAWLSATVAEEESRKFFTGIASDAWVQTPEQTQAFLRQQVDDWRDYVRIAKIEKQ